MGVDKNSHAGVGGQLFELYTRYVSEPESKRHVYGYALLVVGYLLATGGLGVYLVGSTVTGEQLPYIVQEVAIVPAATGLALTLLGIVLMLPVRRRSTFLAVGGTILCFAAVGWFVLAYPQNWSQGTPSFSAQIITVYTTGMALVAGVVVMVPVVTGERSYFSETTVGPEYDHPDIMIGDADRGGAFAVFRDGTEWSWRLIDQSAVAASTTEFLSRIETEERVESVKEQVASAGLIEIKHAAFRLYETGEDAWQWYLMHEDGTVLGEGGRDFDSRDRAEDSINAMKDHGEDAEVFVLDGAAYECYRENGEWGWRLIDEDRTTLSRGVETHASRDAAFDGLASFRERAADAATLAIASYGVELFDAGEGWQWRLRNDAHDHLATSVDAYETKGIAEDAVYDLLDDLQGASVFDGDRPTYDVYEVDDEWGWRLVDETGSSVALGDDDATTQADATEEAREMRAHAGEADVVEIEDLEFETYRQGDAWHWRLVSSDRQIRAESTDAYESESEAAGIVDRVRDEAPEADLLEFDTAAFQVYEADEGAWRWRLIDEDGNVVADSGQGEYDSKDGAMGAMTTLKEHAPDAEHLEIETAAFELFEDDQGWGWRLVDDIGDTIAEGGDRHETEDGARDSMDSLVATVSEADQREMAASIFQVYADADDEWWWRLVLPEGSVIAHSPQSFGTRHAVEDAVDDLRSFADTAAVETLGSLAVLVDPEDWHWELVDAHRDPVAVGTVEHTDREAAAESVEALQRDATQATVYEIREAAFDCYRTDEDWHWRLVDADHEVVAEDAASYGTLEAVQGAVDAIKAAAAEAELLDIDALAFELFADEDGWTWRFVDEDQREVAAGAGRHESRDDAAAELDAVREHIGEASVIEIDSAAFEFDHTDAGWRWRLVDEFGTELARSVDAFATRAEAQEELSVVKEFGPEAWVSVAE